MSVGVRSRTSAAVSPFGRRTCFCHDALKRIFITRNFGEGDGAHIGLSDDVATFWGDHYALAELIATRIFNGLEHTAWDARSTLDTGPVVEFTVVVSRTVVYPVAFGRSSSNLWAGKTAESTADLSDHNDSTHNLEEGFARVAGG
jgi:hypothetical protein